jgi:hypothetical protein
MPTPNTTRPLRHHVEAGDLLGGLHRIEQRQQGHRQHQVHLSGVRGEPGQQRQVLDRDIGRRHVMMAGGDRVEPGVARDDRLLHALPEAQHRVIAARLLRIDEQAEFHEALQIFCRAEKRSAFRRGCRGVGG